MAISETWLLPDGVADVLPEQAQAVETLRRAALDFLAVRGYQLVYTPFIEYIESLSSLSQSNQDLDLVTFKVIDQLSGRLLGVRADMTPQVARIDAHVRPIEGHRGVDARADVDAGAVAEHPGLEFCREGGVRDGRQ